MAFVGAFAKIISSEGIFSLALGERLYTSFTVCSDACVLVSALLIPDIGLTLIFLPAFSIISIPFSCLNRTLIIDNVSPDFIWAIPIRFPFKYVPFLVF